MRVMVRRTHTRRGGSARRPSHVVQGTTDVGGGGGGGGVCVCVCVCVMVLAHLVTVLVCVCVRERGG